MLRCCFANNWRIFSLLWRHRAMVLKIEKKIIPKIRTFKKKSSAFILNSISFIRCCAFISIAQKILVFSLTRIIFYFFIIHSLANLVCLLLILITLIGWVKKKGRKKFCMEWILNWWNLNLFLALFDAAFISRFAFYFVYFFIILLKTANFQPHKEFIMRLKCKPHSLMFDCVLNW